MVVEEKDLGYHCIDRDEADFSDEKPLLRFD